MIDSLRVSRRNKTRSHKGGMGHGGKAPVRMRGKERSPHKLGRVGFRTQRGKRSASW
jgi:hypothetical protein